MDEYADSLDQLEENIDDIIHIPGNSLVTTVLIVEDDRELADIYAEWLQDFYDVRTAYSGEEAFEAFDETVDVVLLDRDLPDVPGRTVLQRLRQFGTDCRVGVVTGLKPDFDIVDMELDQYIVKPVSREELRCAVELLTMLDTLSELKYELSTRKVRRNVLEADKTREELDASEKFERLESEIAMIEDQIETIETRLGTADDESIVLVG